MREQETNNNMRKSKGKTVKKNVGGKVERMRMDGEEISRIKKEKKKGELNETIGG